MFESLRGAPSPEQLSRASVALRPLGSLGAAPPPASPLGADATFVFPSLASGKYRLSLSGIPDWALRTVELNGRAAEDSIVEIVCCAPHHVALNLTDRLSSLRGSVTGTPEVDEESFVFVFPVDNRMWSRAGQEFDSMFRMVRAPITGVFKLDRLFDGDYFVVAVRRISMDLDWREFESLVRLSDKATRVAIRDGKDALVSLRSVDIE